MLIDKQKKRYRYEKSVLKPQDILNLALYFRLCI